MSASCLITILELVNIFCKVYKIVPGTWYLIYIYIYLICPLKAPSSYTCKLEQIFFSVLL